MTKVLKEADARDIRSVYTFVRVDNKVWKICFYFLQNIVIITTKAGFALARKFGLVSKGASKHDPTLETVEKSLARKEKTEQNLRSV